MARHRSAVALAAFVADGRESKAIEITSAPRVRAASVLKPLLAWAAAKQTPFAHDPAWADLAWAAITTSDNGATAELWSRAGGIELLEALNDLVGTRWRIGEGDEHPALRIMVTAVEVARGYAALAVDEAAAGAQVRRWMREVRQDHTFGLRVVARDALGVTEDAVGVKCGWFAGERAHAAVTVDIEERSLGGVVLTSGVPDDVTRAAAQAASGDDVKLIAVHEAVAGEQLRNGIRQALFVASTLEGRR